MKRFEKIITGIGKKKIQKSLTEWYENGEKSFVGSWKYGKKDGLFIKWYKNGQKKSEITWKDGIRNGLDINWYKNGEKESEATFKDKKIISEICWDENGNECECDFSRWEYYRK